MSWNDAHVLEINANPCVRFIGRLETGTAILKIKRVLLELATTTPRLWTFPPHFDVRCEMIPFSTESDFGGKL
jgi:hypothetical protein